MDINVLLVISFSICCIITDIFNALFDIMHYFSWDVGFTNIVVRSTGQSGVETKYRVPTVRGQCGDQGVKGSKITGMMNN